jgi:DNA helicase-2/ATP-dependent DNA helicase PcrA
MRERLESIAGKDAKKVWLGTFHGFCLRLLKEFPEQMDVHRKFRIADTADQMDLIRKSVDEALGAANISIGGLQQVISTAKNKLLFPGEMHRLAEGERGGVGSLEPEIISQVYEMYQRLLKVNHLIDFDDCIFKVVHALETNAELLEELSQRWHHLIVDEFQDTNLSQLRLIELLGSKHRNVCVVGDDDQSIYSWRGALPEVISAFEQKFEGTEQVFLEQNYRCTNLILDAANSLIRNNKKRKDKKLWSATDEVFPIDFFTAKTDAAEADMVVEKAMSLKARGVALSDIAVLYRSNKQARALELSFRAAGFPYKTYGGQSVFERKEIKDFLAYLRVVSNVHERLGFWRIVNTPPRGLGIKSLERIEASSEELKISPFTALQKEDGLASTTLAKKHAFQEWVQSANKEQPRTVGEIKPFFERILKSSDLVEDIRRRVKDIDTRLTKMGNLQSCSGWLADAAKRWHMREIERAGKNPENPDSLRFSLRGFLDSLTLDGKDFGEDDDKNHVSLMTVHAAKGLEFHGVFAVGLEDKLFPHENSLESIAGLDEERRLFYVAITRAKRELFLSMAWSRKKTTQMVSCMPSMFLKELGEAIDPTANAKAVAAHKKNKDNHKKKTLSRLANLAESLSSPSE